MKIATFLNEAAVPYISQDRLRCCYNCKFFDEKGTWKFVCDNVDFKGAKINPAGVCIRYTKA